MTRALIGIVQRTRDGLRNKQAGEEFAPGSERQADKPPGKHVGGAARVEGGQKKKKKKEMLAVSGHAGWGDSLDASLQSNSENKDLPASGKGQTGMPPKKN